MLAVNENRESQSRIAPHVWGTIAILLALYTLSFIDRQIITLMVKPVREGLAIDDVQIALVHGVAFSLFYAIAGVPFGWLVDRHSARLLVFLGVLGWSFSTIACGFAANFWDLFIARLGVGVAEAVLVPAAFSIIAAAVPKGRLSLASSIFMMGSLFGGALAFAVGGAVISAVSKGPMVTLPLFGQLAPWRAAFVLVGLPGLVAAFLAWLFPRRHRIRPRPSQSNEKEAAFGTFLTTRWVFLASHLTGFAILGAAAYGSQAWGPAHMAADFKWSPLAIGLGFAAVMGIAGSLGNVVAAVVVDRFYSRGMRDAHHRVHLVTTLIGCPLGIAAFLVDDPWAMLALLALSYSTLISFAGTATGALQLVAPPNLRGRVASLYSVALAIGGAGLGPLLIAFVSSSVLGHKNVDGSAVAISLGLCAIVALPMIEIARRRFVAAQDLVA
jgi:MFS family permease